MRSTGQASAQTLTQLKRIDMQALGLVPGRRRIDGLPPFRGQERVFGRDEWASAVEPIEAPPPQPRSLAAEHTIHAASAAENRVTCLDGFDRPLAAVGHEDHCAGNETGDLLRLCRRDDSGSESGHVRRVQQLQG